MVNTVDTSLSIITKDGLFNKFTTNQDPFYDSEGYIVALISNVAFKQALEVFELELKKEIIIKLSNWKTEIGFTGQKAEILEFVIELITDIINQNIVD